MLKTILWWSETDRHQPWPLGDLLVNTWWLQFAKFVQIRQKMSKFAKNVKMYKNCLNSREKIKKLPKVLYIFHAATFILDDLVRVRSWDSVSLSANYNKPCMSSLLKTLFLLLSLNVCEIFLSWNVCEILQSFEKWGIKQHYWLTTHI